MSNTILFFRVYVIFSLLFLIPFSYFISLELLHFVKFNPMLYLPFNLFIKEFKLDQKNVMLLFNFYCDRRKWFLSICLLELSCALQVLNKDLVFVSLAYLYRQLSYWTIAEYYYLKAISYSPYNVDVLSSLANMYDILDQTEKATCLYNQILFLDNGYSVPKRYLSCFHSKSG
uniref:Uncharacterized protein n=1 Tax=Bostrychia tenella TaxID=324755 RepID=A0A1Z1M509_9FLOR|nr:hypothetical protein [Bostrychia tenella]ARW61148.1 hypothetical protein [Bostrychia tenella]